MKYYTKSNFIALFIAAPLVIGSGILLSAYKGPEVLGEGVAIESFGMLFDIIILGIFVSWLNGRGEDVSKINSIEKENLGYAAWKSQEAAYRLYGNLQALVELGVERQKIINAHFATIDLSPVDISHDGGNFKKFILSKSDFTNSNLIRADFTESVLEKCIYNDAIVQLTNFGKSRLINASFIKTKGMFADFSQANLMSSDMSEGIFAGAKFIGCDLLDVIFENTNLNGADFTDAKQVTAEQLMRAKTIYIAKGIPDEILSEIKVKRPDLLLKPKECYLETHDDYQKESREEQLEYLSTLLADMSYPDALSVLDNLYKDGNIEGVKDCLIRLSQSNRPHVREKFSELLEVLQKTED